LRLTSQQLSDGESHYFALSVRSESRCGFLQRKPSPFAQRRLAPSALFAFNVEQETGNEKAQAPFVAFIAADFIARNPPANACFLASLFQRGLSFGLTGFDDSLGKHPTALAA
jgi:hypothetical protein